MRIEGAVPGLAMLLVLLLVPPAAATPLAPEACAALKTEYAGLVAGGAKADMDRGPDWAKSNLAPERLGKIERLIAVEEQLSFRCDNQMTARPVLKEQPKLDPDKPDKPDAKDTKTVTLEKRTPSNIPPPKRKDMAAAAKAASVRKESAGD
ncbi:MAG: hypothetical protein AB7S70_14565 [Hyphomicrobium sp.]|uniref:hypothetical protein n=1 Tax=Hyphomicrobium sp. TaxID=82 RepID=UPI003D0C8B36